MANRKTLVVNLYAGPGAGKTTGAWIIAGELKKLNIVTEYVSEYAKELIWDNESHLLGGSFKNQFNVLKEQNRRINRLIGKVDVVVTDSPILQQGMYVQERIDEFNNIAFSLYNMYSNFDIFIERGHYFEQAGRIHSREESIEIDTKIKNFFKQNRIEYKVCRHDTLSHVINDIKISLDII